MTQTHLPPPPPTQPVTWLARLTGPIAGACLSSFMLVGLVTTVYTVATGKLDLLPKAPTWPSFLDGRVTQGIADALAGAPVPRESARIERGFSWMAIGDLGPRVRQGCPGWLFLADEFKPHPNAQANAQSRLQELVRAKERLASQGARLLVTVVPDKSRMEAANLCGLYRPAAFETRLKGWTDALAAAGVDVLDLQPAMARTASPADGEDDGSGAFLRTDTHWNERGARSAAQAVAQKVQAMGMTATPTQHYLTTPQKPTARAGDLVRLAGIDSLPVSRQPRADIQRATTFTASDGSTGMDNAVGASQAGQLASGAASGMQAPAPSPSSAPTEEDLFGDAKAPNIAVIGTSFSRTSNFVPFLQAALNTTVVNAAMDGGDFSGAARQYFQGPTFKETPPALVIWEIPERVLQQPRRNDDIGLK